MPMSTVRFRVCAIVLGLSLLGGAAVAATFSLPAGANRATWEAEAALHGSWARVDRPEASGSAYVSTNGSADAGALEFPFEAKEATALRVWPVWWRDGEETYAYRFPYPLPAQPGPDAVAECTGLIFFTAPMNGRVGVVDARREKLVGSIEVGGYLTDIIDDPGGKAVYVADALGNRIVVIDPQSLRIVGTIATPKEPWSLAFDKSVLFVACRGGKCIATVDLAQRKVLKTSTLPAAPLHVELRDKPEAHLAVWSSPQVFDAATCAALAPDEQSYGGSAPRTSVRVNQQTVWDCSGPGSVRLKVGKDETTVDVSSVTRSPRPCLALLGKRLCFTAPEEGRVGVIDTEKKTLIKTIEVGGKPVDMVADPERGKLYVADGEGSRVVTIDANSLSVTKAVPVPEVPVSLELVGNVVLQRPYLETPVPINKLFVVCGEEKALVAIDLVTGQIMAEAKLPSEPDSVHFVPVANPEWWPLLPLERISFAETPKVAVDLAPVSLDLGGGSPASLAEGEPRTYTPRRQAKADGKTFSGDNALLIGVAGPPPAGEKTSMTRAVDVTAVADPQTAPVRPLAAGDIPGAITLSVDDGPEYDWLNGRWMTPDNQTFLVGGSDEFLRWNAPVFRVGPGPHVLKVHGHSAHANLDALAVMPTLDGSLQVRVLPEPRKVHEQVRLPGYQGVFYDQEPVKFTVEVTNTGPQPVKVALAHELRDYMNDVVPESGGEARRPVAIGAGKTVAAPLEFALKETGRFTLTVTAKSPAGDTETVARFVRLPKLVHPRLFFRPEDVPAIRERMAKYPNLYRRYAQWLARQVEKEAPYFPERFLPPGLTQKACGSAAPPSIKGEGTRNMMYGWRMYELGWRMFACEFMSLYTDYPESKVLAEKMAPLVNSDASDWYVEFHHHGPFYPGAAESLYDMAPDAERPNLKLAQVFARGIGDMNVMPWMMVSLEEPLTPEKRATVLKLMEFANNRDEYFQTHMGSRAGTWWQNPWTACHCPIHGYFLSMMLTTNFFGEDRYLTKDIVKSILTFDRYVDPITDKRRILPSLDTPNGEPWRWLQGAITRHPLEATNYQWDTWIAKLNGDLPGNEVEQVDKLFALQGMPNTGPLGGGVRHFVTGVAVPVGLALGWYDPATDKVTEPELPPTTVFDFEGWAAMKSGWDANATEVVFVSGPRDHTNRQQPNHFTLMKAGDFLIGTPANYGDDGNPTPSWGNTVVVGDDWVTQWRRNLYLPRERERLIINRFSPMTFTYINRDRRLAGFNPAEGGWGGGLDLHGHTETPLWGQGTLLAYETRPEYDYVAGDATNAWPADQVGEMVRQVVFLKPDLVVVYDRVKLNGSNVPTRWVATTAPKLAVRSDGFRAGAGAVAVQAKVLLPEGATVDKGTLLTNFMWKDQELVRITPAAPSDTVEYLVVLQTGNDQVAPPEAKLVHAEGMSGADVTIGGKTVRVMFRKDGAVGGEVTLGDGTRNALPDKIVDTYANWQSDPRFKAWMTEKRFDFVISEADRKAYGGG